MQNKEKTCACPSGGFKTMCGGQALIEGIMMRGPKKQAVVVRKPDGTLAIRESQLRFIKDRFPVLGLPLIRGMVTFVASMVEGVRALMYSAEFFPEEEGETEESSRFEAWLERTLGSDQAASFFVTVSVILGIGMSIGLFFLLPTLLGSVVTFFTDSMVVRNVAESLMKLAIFVGYLALCSRMKDIHRVFQYHGAEHKTIFCYEAGLPPDGGERAEAAPPPSPVRDQLPVYGHRDLHSSLYRCVWDLAGPQRPVAVCGPPADAAHHRGGQL